MKAQLPRLLWLATFWYLFPTVYPDVRAWLWSFLKVLHAMTTGKDVAL